MRTSIYKTNVLNGKIMARKAIFENGKLSPRTQSFTKTIHILQIKSNSNIDFNKKNKTTNDCFTKDYVDNYSEAPDFLFSLSLSSHSLKRAL